MKRKVTHITHPRKKARVFPPNRIVPNVDALYPPLDDAQVNQETINVDLTKFRPSKSTKKPTPMTSQKPGNRVKSMVAKMKPRPIQKPRGNFKKNENGNHKPNIVSKAKPITTASINKKTTTIRNNKTNVANAKRKVPAGWKVAKAKKLNPGKTMEANGNLEKAKEISKIERKAPNRKVMKNKVKISGDKLPIILKMLLPRIRDIIFQHCDHCHKNKPDSSNSDFLRGPTCNMLRVTFGLSFQQAGNIYAWFRNQRKKNQSLDDILNQFENKTETKEEVAKENKQKTTKTVSKITNQNAKIQASKAKTTISPPTAAKKKHLIQKAATPTPPKKVVSNKAAATVATKKKMNKTKETKKVVKKTAPQSSTKPKSVAPVKKKVLLPKKTEPKKALPAKPKTIVAKNKKSLATVKKATTKKSNPASIPAMTTSTLKKPKEQKKKKDEKKVKDSVLPPAKQKKKPYRRRKPSMPNLLMNPFQKAEARAPPVFNESNSYRTSTYANARNHQPHPQQYHQRPARVTSTFRQNRQMNNSPGSIYTKSFSQNQPLFNPRIVQNKARRSLDHNNQRQNRNFRGRHRKTQRHNAPQRQQAPPNAKKNSDHDLTFESANNAEPMFMDLQRESHPLFGDVDY